MEKTDKRTKIVATVGPASNKPEIIRTMLSAGVNVFRLNFSHSTADSAREVIRIVREARSELRILKPIMADIKGPAVRVYGYAEPIDIEEGATLVIESRAEEGIQSLVSEEPLHIYTNLPRIDTFCSIGQRVLLMDGYFSGEVTQTGKGAVSVRISNAGQLRPKAHLTLPNVDYPIPFLSEKVIRDITQAVEEEVEYIALSFVRETADIEEVRWLVQRVGAACGKNVTCKLIAKIESAKGLSNADQIIAAADGIMVARGDMGVEVAIQKVPTAQKRLIRSGYLAAKPVTTATQMLESMIESPMPTRAEASDVANACFDSTSAVMLSGETAVGHYPVKVVETIGDIIREVESAFDYEEYHRNMPPEVKAGDLSAIMSYNAVSVACECNAAAIFVLTETGHAARLISRLRPHMPIFAFAKYESVYHQLTMNWGVCPMLLEVPEQELDRIVSDTIQESKVSGVLKKGDRVVYVAGLPLDQPGTTNMIRVEAVA